jgi:hypothetical protein
MKTTIDMTFVDCGIIAVEIGGIPHVNLIHHIPS